MSRGRALPEAIQNAPEMYVGLGIYYQAFLELNTCRTIKWNGGPGKIPWTAINTYGQRHGFEDTGFDYLVDMVRALDDAYLEHAESQEKN